MSDKVYVRVSHDGSISRDPRVTREELHMANFVVVEKEGDLVVLKDRYGRPGRVLSKQDADARAFDHLDVAQGRKSSKDIYIF